MAGISNVSAQSQLLTKSVYYGEKANDSYKNPCKGECVRVCAEISNEVIVGRGSNNGIPVDPLSDGGGTVLVKTTVKDADGNVINERVDSYVGDVETVKRELQIEAIKNGGVIE